MIIADCGCATNEALRTGRRVIRHGRRTDGTRYFYEDDEVFCESHWMESEQARDEEEIEAYMEQEEVDWSDPMQWPGSPSARDIHSSTRRED